MNQIQADKVSTGISINDLSADDRAIFHQVQENLKNGLFQEAEAALLQLSDRYPDFAVVKFLLANLNTRKGNIHHAIELLEQAKNLEPSNTEILIFLAKCYFHVEELDKAIDCNRKLEKLLPGSAVFLRNIGGFYKLKRAYTEAIKYLSQALEIDPEDISALNSYYTCLMGLNQPEKAIEVQKKILRLQPDNHNQHANMAQALLWTEKFEESIEHFKLSSKLYIENLPPPTPDNPIRATRLVHDFEQLEYLCQRGLVDAKHAEYLEILRPIAGRARKILDKGDNLTLELPAEEVRQIKPFFNKHTHVGDGSRISGPVMNPELDVASIEAEYHSVFPEILVLDNVLTEEALDKLYRYCLESRIYSIEYDSGYVGSMLATGFASPLLLQISEAIRTTFPRIFRDYRLTQSWSFKYDSKMTGIKRHADFAQVNMNFWISPDEGNLDPDHGGLVVWDKASPQDWKMSDYNGNEEKVSRFLAESGAKPITIPFRRNRAAIFNSSLFHRTDDIHFKDEYKNRRINVTFLFGTRLKT